MKRQRSPCSATLSLLIAPLAHAWDSTLSGKKSTGPAECRLRPALADPWFRRCSKSASDSERQTRRPARSPSKARDTPCRIFSHHRLRAVLLGHNRNNNPHSLLRQGEPLNEAFETCNRQQLKFKRSLSKVISTQR